MSILHFAPERELEAKFRDRFPRYETADLFEKADLCLDLENIDLPDDTYDLVIANHVLEHVNDFKATGELKRILNPGGLLITMVPIVEGWESTYENDQVETKEERWLHFGQGDHVRYYGRDFRDRVQRCGLELLQEITAEGAELIRYGLLRGEKAFVFVNRR